MNNETPNTKTRSKGKTPEVTNIANVVLIPLGELIENQNIRSNMDDAQLRELADDIQERGLLQPIIVTPERGNHYRIIAGHRRAAAVRMTAATAVPAIVMKMSNTDAKIAQIAENIQREDLSLQDESRALLGLKKDGMNLQTLANLVHKSRSWVSKRIACAEDLDWRIEELMRDGVTEDPEIILALKQLSQTDWQAFTQTVEGLRAGTETRDSIRETMSRIKDRANKKKQPEIKEPENEENTKKEDGTPTEIKDAPTQPTDMRELQYRLIRDRHNQPLVSLESPLGNGQEISPHKLRNLAYALIEIATEAEGRDMGKGYLPMNLTREY